MFIYDSPLGKLGITTADDAVMGISFAPKQQEYSEPNAKVIEAIEQLEQYFNNPQYKFNLPMKLQGTELQKKVWQALRTIPCGTVKTYGELAEQLGTSPRVIGNACRSNPVPIIIPCHRVVAQNGLGGYCGAESGKMLDTKQWLLRHEQCDVNTCS